MTQLKRKLPKRVAPCPKCKGAVNILPKAGGNSFETTTYMARCENCEHTVLLATLSGRRDSARREWNRSPAMTRPTESEIVAALREATDVLEELRRGHGVDVSAACYPALNNCRDVLERIRTR